MDVKGVILAGGKGSRLQPATFAMNKHMIPILNKPMIMYPIETLTKVFGIKDILIVSGGEHLGSFADFLGDGSKHDADLTYKVQPEAGGIAQALGLAKDFLAGSRSVVVLGDNIFDNEQLAKDLKDFRFGNDAVVFLKEVGKAEAVRFGVPKFVDDSPGKKIEKIIEKPKLPPSPYAVTGLYAYQPDVIDLIGALSPSARGELEVTDLNNLYLNSGRLSQCFISGFWSDAGTPASLARSTAWAAGLGE